MTAAGEHKKKLIEVALPLDEINAACKADKDRKTGTVRNFAKWFAPAPLPAWRALLFASLVDDPGNEEGRAALLGIVKGLVANGADLPSEPALEAARSVLREQFPEGLPVVLDPFCGGGSTLIEAQRLGLPSFGSDMNPVPALISRTLTQTLPALVGHVSLHPEWSAGSAIREEDEEGEGDEYTLALKAAPSSRHLDGFAHDVAYYGALVGQRAWNKVGSVYPQGPAVPIAWLWARTVTCQNPACRVETFLTTSWWLSKKAGDLAWIDPTVGDDGTVVLRVSAGQRTGGPDRDGTKVGRGANFICVACGQPLTEDYVISEGVGGRLGLRMVAVVETLDGQRRYRQPTTADVVLASGAPAVDGFPSVRLPDIPRWFSGPRFGFNHQADLYTPRQLYTLASLADEVAAVREDVLRDGGSAMLADAIASVLALVLSNQAAASSNLTRWRQRLRAHAKAEPAFGRSDVPLMWDFAEVFFRGGSVGDWNGAIRSTLRALAYVPSGSGTVVRADARSVDPGVACLVATDPPYFDAIGYADLSDFFYVWHRRVLKSIYPDLYQTIAAPRTGELTAVPAHHGDDDAAAKAYFIAGFTETFHNLQRNMRPGLPMLVIYASKEQKAGRHEEETRWSSILTAMIRADLEITGTWPIHGTGTTRMIGQGTNAVATYVVMVCRPRPSTASVCSVADFNRALRRELKSAVKDLQAAGILPVDLAQAAMGPGMQIYSRYSAVVDQTGATVPVDEALRLINSALGEVLDDQEGELDAASRFAIAWYEHHGWNEGRFDLADKMVRPKGIAVEDLVHADVITLAPGWVSLKGQGDLNRTWLPSKDKHPTAWEAVHHLADRLIDGGGSQDAGALMAVLGTWRDPAQALVYRLHDIAAKNGWTKDQERYNALIASWSDLLQVAATAASHDDDGGVLF